MFIICIVLIVYEICQTECYGSSVTFPTPTFESDSVLWQNETSAYIPNPQKRDEVTWNPHIETAQQFQGRLCPERCNGTQKVNAVSRARCLQCFPCRCDKSCHFYGTCCPPVEQEVWQPPPADRSECKKAGFTWVHRVATCPPSYSHNETRFLCESKSAPRRRDTVLPVTVFQTKVTYRNTHCALCNRQFPKFLEWEMECIHNQYLYDVLNDTQYDDRAILLPDVCTPVLKSYIWNQEHLCKSSRLYYPPTNPISTCNVTGQWIEEKEHVRNACEESDWSRGQMVTVKINDSNTNTQVYRNIFCALCNEAPPVMTPHCHFVAIDISDNHFEHITLTQLITSSGPNYKVFGTSVEKCPPSHWKHPMKGCQQLQCSTGKVAGHGTGCVTPVDRVRGLGYHLSLLIQPVSLITHRLHPPHTTTTTTAQPSTSPPPPPPLMSIIPQLKNHTIGCSCGAVLKRAIYDALWGVSFDVSATFQTADSQGEACFVQAYQSDLETLMGDGKVTVSAVDNITQRWQRDIDDDAQLSASFLAAVADVNVIAKPDKDRTDFESHVVTGVFLRDLTVHVNEWTVKLRVFDRTSGLFNSITNRVGGGNKIFFPYDHQFVWKHPLNGLEHLFIPFSGLFLCQHLSFYEDEFEVEVSEGKVLVRFSSYLNSDLEPVSFDARDFPNEVKLEGERELVMCVRVYGQVFPDNVTVVQSGQGVSLTRQIMSVVCSSVSVVSLVLTFSTYCLFAELRSLPGLNNMGLCLSLALAQLSLLIPWLRDTGNSQVCMVVGMATHWLWLMALLWMSAGCTHMARVFVSKARHVLSDGEVKKAFLRNVLFTVFLSAGMVILTVVTVAVSSAGSSMGYGGRLCFLDTRYHPLMVLAFVLPLTAVVLTNLVCFLFTVLAILRVRRLQAQGGTGGRDVLVYAKLSTVTGTSWLLALLAEGAGQEWMLVLAELCTASQGLMLCLAYVCNRRVWRLYRARFGSNRQSAQTSASATAVTVSSPGVKISPTDV